MRIVMLVLALLCFGFKSTDAISFKGMKKITLKLNQRTRINDQVSLTLVRHSHKITEEENVESPLGVTIEIVYKDGREELFDEWIDLSGDRKVTIADIAFKVIEYKYGEWMDLELIEE
jgi:predicted double-glycine peptidase